MIGGEKETRNSKTLADFVAYCEANPSQRFWQALRNWSNHPFIYVTGGGGEIKDTFHWEGKNEYDR